MTLAFEDFQPGLFRSLGPRLVTREEMIAFASEYDPQPMHLDEEAAKHSMLRGLSGSGWHMCAIAMRMQVDGFLNDTLSLGGLGVEETRWMAPLRPGDRVTLDVHVLEARLSKGRPGAGIVKTRLELFNASRVCLMTMVLSALMGCRPPSAPGAS